MEPQALCLKHAVILSKILAKATLAKPAALYQEVIAWTSACELTLAFA